MSFTGGGGKGVEFYVGRGGVLESGVIGFGKVIRVSVRVYLRLSGFGPGYKSVDGVLTREIRVSVGFQLGYTGSVRVLESEVMGFD